MQEFFFSLSILSQVLSVTGYTLGGLKQVSLHQANSVPLPGCHPPCLDPYGNGMGSNGD